MDRHVIKGRGENRGKYLCYARMAGLEPGGGDDGFVWLPEQRKAARWKDPRYSGRTYATEIARKYNGYFVKLVARQGITREMVDDLKAYISKHAEGAPERSACYWFNGDLRDASEEYCRDCAEQVVDEEYAKDSGRFEKMVGECRTREERHDAAIDGGLDIDHDSPPYCERCGKDLSGSLTEYGADQELDALTSYDVDSKDARSWALLDLALVNVADDDPRWRHVARVVAAAQEQERQEAERLTALAVTPGMPEARASLVGLLAARAIQKAPEPSYRLWSEFLRWRALPFEKRLHPSRKTEAWEKRLVNEATVFLGLLGYERRGGDSFKAPYGTYYWPFVVNVEQHRLWRTPAFLEGQAQAPRHRDANPYAKGTVEHDAWDGGYMSMAEALS